MDTKGWQGGPVKSRPPKDISPLVAVAGRKGEPVPSTSWTPFNVRERALELALDFTRGDDVIAEDVLSNAEDFLRFLEGGK